MMKQKIIFQSLKNYLFNFIKKFQKLKLFKVINKNKLEYMKNQMTQNKYGFKYHYNLFLIYKIKKYLVQ